MKAKADAVNMTPYTFTLLAALSLNLPLTACDKPETPEHRLRALVEAAETAAEKKDIGSLRGYVSASYADEEGRDRRTLDGILRLYLLRHENIHLLTRIESVTWAPPNRARVVVYLAMAARPIASVEELGAFRANLYRLEIGLIEEGTQWRAVRAAWRPAEPADFIYQN